MKHTGHARVSHTRAAPEHAQLDAEAGHFAHGCLPAPMFDYYLTSSHPFVVATGNNLARWMLCSPRQRKPRAGDVATLYRIVHAIMANLAKAIAVDRAGAVHVSLRASHKKLTRYDPHHFNRLSQLASALDDTGTLTLSRSCKKGAASLIIPGAVFRETMRRFRVGADHFAQSEGQETILLCRTEHDYVDGKVKRELIDYSDRPDSKRFRAEMAIINGALRKADMRFLQHDGGAPILTRMRQLRRHFNLRPQDDDDAPRFDQNGRLFGGWWQNISRESRGAIRLDGEEIADLDFAQMFLRLAYLLAGLTPPNGDLYAGLLGRLGEARWRPGIKLVSLSMLSRDRPLARLPKDAKALLPPDVIAREVRSAILDRHPLLKPVFETGIGLRLMFTESQILVAAMLRLIQQDGLNAILPMHDGLMVPKSKGAVAERAMQGAAEEIVGFRLPVAIKSLK